MALWRGRHTNQVRWMTTTFDSVQDMNTMHAAWQFVRSYPGGAVALAPVINKNHATLSHEVSPNVPTAKFGLEDAVALSVWANKDLRIVSAFAAELDAMVLRLPKIDPHGTSFEALSGMAREFADLVSAVTDAASDGRVTPNELRNVQTKAGDLIAHVQATVHHLMAMGERDRGEVAV